MLILPAHIRGRTAAAVLLRPAKQLFKKAAVVAVVCVAAVVKVKIVAVPVRRRLKATLRRPCAGLLVAAGIAQLVIGGALFRVGEYGIGFIHFSHARRCIGFFADVRMVFARQLAKSFFDGVRTGVFRDAERLVVVFVFHLALLCLPTS